MKPQPFAKIALALAAILAAGPALPAKADWLVTREGARVETQGAWKVKGKLVVFHTSTGKLSSLRVAEVDLDASRRATEPFHRSSKSALISSSFGLLSGT